VYLALDVKVGCSFHTQLNKVDTINNKLC